MRFCKTGSSVHPQTVTTQRQNSATPTKAGGCTASHDCVHACVCCAAKTKPCCRDCCCRCVMAGWLADREYCMDTHRVGHHVEALTQQLRVVQHLGHLGVSVHQLQHTHQQAHSACGRACLAQASINASIHCGAHCQGAADGLLVWLSSAAESAHAAQNQHASLLLEACGAVHAQHHREDLLDTCNAGQAPALTSRMPGFICSMLRIISGLLISCCTMGFCIICCMNPWSNMPCTHVTTQS